MTPDGRPSKNDKVLALYQRYVTEFIERLNLCPWAETARKQGEVRVELIEGPFDQGVVERYIDEVAADTTLNIGIAIFVDLVEMPWAQWRSTVAGLQRSEAARHRPRRSPMAMAAFHPDAPDDVSTAGRLTSFIRRSPDVTLQLVRQSTLESVRDDSARRTAFYDPKTMDIDTFLATRKPPNFSSRIVEANRKSLGRFGVDEAAAFLAELRAARLALEEEGPSHLDNVAR